MAANPAASLPQEGELAARRIYSSTKNCERFLSAVSIEDDVDYAGAFAKVDSRIGSLRRHVRSLLGSLRNFVLGSKVEVGEEEAVDLIEVLLDKAESLREADGQRQDVASIIGRVNNSKIESSFGREGRSLTPRGSRRPMDVVEQKPQEKFRDTFDNSYAPFKPKLSKKPNAVVPLHRSSQSMPPPQDALEAHALSLARSSTLSADVYQDEHPYHEEICSFSPSSDDNTFLTVEQVLSDISEFSVRAEIVPTSLEETPFTWIDTVKDLEKMLNSLRGVKEFAVDLENHSLRSYQGFVCLMQISTRDQDFLIDTLELRRELECLNEVFTNPHIKKIFHGADSDILWLQRDFGLYVVNLFDTGQAARALELPKCSLAFLLRHFCQQYADKRYQLADWRLRPLSEDMIRYARMDTRFLLYIYDCLHNQLLKHGGDVQLLTLVYEKSKELCLRMYRKETVTESSHLAILRRAGEMSDKEESILKATFQLRDRIARAEDESPEFVLSAREMIAIARSAPTAEESVMHVLRPNGNRSDKDTSWDTDTRLDATLQRKHAHEIAHCVIAALAEDETRSRDWRAAGTETSGARHRGNDVEEETLLSPTGEKTFRSVGWVSAPPSYCSTPSSVMGEDAQKDKDVGIVEILQRPLKNSPSTIYGDGESDDDSDAEIRETTLAADSLMKRDDQSELLGMASMLLQTPVRNAPQQALENEKDLERQALAMTPISNARLCGKPRPMELMTVDEGNEEEGAKAVEETEAQSRGKSSESSPAPPSSLTAIYRLSNKNRGKNRGKKKASEGADVEGEETQLPDPYGDGGSRKKQKQQLEDEIQFMQSLGWIADTDRRSGVGTMEIERKNRFEDAFRISAPAGGSRGMDMHRRRVGHSAGYDSFGNGRGRDREVRTGVRGVKRSGGRSATFAVPSPSSRGGRGRKS